MAAFNEFSERFLEIIDELGYSDYKVWNEVESLSKATMSKIRRGVCGVSMNALSDFVAKYPNVSAHYIITGRGSKWVTTDVKCTEITIKSNEYELQILKLQNDLRDAYAEIGELRMMLKASNELNKTQKTG